MELAPRHDPEDGRGHPGPQRVSVRPNSVTLVVRQAGDKEAVRSARSDLKGREHAPEWLTQDRAMDRNQGDAV